jgi:hypothetical protein
MGVGDIIKNPLEMLSGAGMLIDANGSVAPLRAIVGIDADTGLPVVVTVKNGKIECEISGEGLATQDTLAAILTKLSGDPATQTTLASILVKLADPATQTTLAAVLAKLSADPATQTTLAAISGKLTNDPATQTTLAAVLAKFPDQVSSRVPVVIGTELPLGTKFIGRSGAVAFKFLQSFTRLNSATPYSPGDVVNNSDTAPAILSQDLTAFGAALSQFILITNVQVVSSVKNVLANLTAYIFSQTFDATADNLELSIDDATVASGGHVVALPNVYCTALNTKLQADPGQYIMQLAAAGTPTLFVALQTPSGYTPSNSEVYTVIINGYLL